MFDAEYLYQFFLQCPPILTVLSRPCSVLPSLQHSPFLVAPSLALPSSQHCPLLAKPSPSPLALPSSPRPHLLATPSPPHCAPWPPSPRALLLAQAAAQPLRSVRCSSGCTLLAALITPCLALPCLLRPPILTETTPSCCTLLLAALQQSRQVSVIGDSRNHLRYQINLI